MGAIGTVDDVDDAGEEGFVGVSRDDDSTLGDAVGIGGLLKDAPDVAGLVDLVDVGGQRDLDA